MGRKKTAFAKCIHCDSWIPKKYLANHKRVCLVRRGLKQKPIDEKIGDTFTAKKGESINELLARMKRK